ncbi:hypothetical protein B0H10DRAFT_1211448 [Mycena sp. CBHHK59/15]|nr:hypothetical protein B0H10DRAFT_1211448 [Mycena sp. CBHHK59/15]
MPIVALGHSFRSRSSKMPKKEQREVWPPPGVPPSRRWLYKWHSSHLPTPLCLRPAIAFVAVIKYIATTLPDMKEAHAMDTNHSPKTQPASSDATDIFTPEVLRQKIRGRDTQISTLRCSLRTARGQYKNAIRASIPDISRVDIENLKQRVAALERSLRQASDLRKKYRDQLAEYKYPVLTLPNEVVAEIFLHFIPAYPQPPQAIGLSSPALLLGICALWRDIALSTPGLWRSVGIDFDDPNPRMIRAQRQLLTRWLSRSGACPLSLSLSCPMEDHRPSLEFMHALDAIVPYAARWQHLSVIMPFHTLRLLTVYPTPLLRSVFFGASPWPSQPAVLEARAEHIFAHAPVLRRLVLAPRAFLPIYLQPWAQLTSVIALRLTCTECTEILRYAVRLVVFSAQVFIDNPRGEFYPLAYDRYGVGIPAQRTAVPPLAHLKQLTLLDGNLLGQTTAHRRVLELLTLPALEVLDVAQDCLAPHPEDVLVGLFARSQCKLTWLHVAGELLDDEWYLERFPDIRRMTFGRLADFYGCDSETKT